jgi:hypothetical protein
LSKNLNHTSTSERSPNQADERITKSDFFALIHSPVTRVSGSTVRTVCEMTKDVEVVVVVVADVLVLLSFLRISIYLILYVSPIKGYLHTQTNWLCILFLSFSFETPMMYL